MPRPSWLKGITVTALGLSCACCDLAGPNDLVPALRVQPDTVVPGDTFHVRVTVRNPTFATVTLVSGYSCAVLPIISRDGEAQHFDGTDLGCLAVGREFPIAPRDSVFWDFQVVALLLGSKPRFAYVTPPPAGDYTVRAEMQVQLPDMEALLVVESMPQHRRHRGGP